MDRSDWGTSATVSHPDPAVPNPVSGTDGAAPAPAGEWPSSLYFAPGGGLNAKFAGLGAT
jgi:hypothetical protein